VAGVIDMKKTIFIMMLLLSVLSCKLIADPAYASPGGYDSDSDWFAEAFSSEPSMNDVIFDVADDAAAESVIAGLKGLDIARSHALKANGVPFTGQMPPWSNAGGNGNGNGMDNSNTTEVPEPTTLAMLGLGCLVFVKKKKA
jgi:hypothetical protein